MDIFQKMLLLLCSILPLAAATFFPFTTFRPSFPQPQPRFGYRPQRSPPSNLVPVQSPILGLRIYVPRELLGLLNGRPPSSFGPDYSQPNYPRPNPFVPHPNYPQEHRPNEYPHPQDFPPNGNFAPSLPPFDATSFINLMRALYPDMIYRPDPRYPNVFAIRFPRELPPYPGLRPPPGPNDYYPEQNQLYPGEFPPNISQLLEPPPNLTEQNQPSPSYNQPTSSYNPQTSSYNQPSSPYNQPSSSYNQPPNNNQQQPSQNHLIIIR